jgi:glycosyltransferase involved in cell wall biosynthesis
LKDFENIAQTEDERNRIVRIYNPLDTREIIAKSESTQLDYDFNDVRPVFVSIGTVFPQKGFDRLLRAHRRLLDEGLVHRLLIIGDGYDFQNISKLRTDLDLEQTVTLLGFIENPYPYLKQADFFVLSSRYEGFPTVLYEAFVLKMSIIATDVSGVREILNNGELGLIIENSEDGIYNGMKSFMTDPQLAAHYQNKIVKFTQPFSLENSVRKIQDIIDAL